MKSLIKLCLWVCLLATVAYGQQYGPYSCTKTASVATTSGTIQILPATVQTYRICAIWMQVVQPSSSPANFGIYTGTGTNCSAGASGILSPTGGWTGVANTIQGYTSSIPYGAGVFVSPNLQVCLYVSAAPTSAQMVILYDTY